MRAERFKVVSTLDPALDMTSSEVFIYGRDRDFTQLRFLPGEKPTVFHVREVPHGLWEPYVASAESISERYKRAFAAGVERVDNLMQPDGVALQSWSPSFRHPRLKGVVMMTDEECNLFSPAEREEIGYVVYQHSFLQRRIAVAYQLPPLFLELLVARRFRPVESSQSTAADQSSEKPSASTSPSQVATGSA